MNCPNARVKIIRQDNTVMRDDFKNNKNTKREDIIYAYKRLLERNGIELFEEMYKVKFSKFQKWCLNKLFNRKRNQ